VAWGTWLLVALLLVIAALLFTGVYFAFPQPQGTHFNGLLTIGVLALFFALGSYFAESVSAQPTAQRALAWGFLAMGFSTLILTDALGADGSITYATRFWGLILILVLLVGVVIFATWRGRSVRADVQRAAEHAAWQARPAPSAFLYSTARPPTVSPPPSPPNAPPPTRPGSGGP
jgi:uncharacterized membrane protein